MSLQFRLAIAAGLGLGAVLLPISWGCQGTCGSSTDCASDEFCSIASGVCITPKSRGFCKPKPTTCAQVLDPICGCDGKTYSNSCEASIAAVSVVAAGACGASCGGVPGLRCGATEFCDFTAGSCGSVAPSGACKAVPTACPDTSSPVCGCDQKTYKNECEAAKAQVPLLATGECACGGPEGVACETGRYCQLAVGDCLEANAPGTCVLPPTQCSSVASPVCGCDGVVYDNACEAAKSRMSVTGTETCTTIDGG